MEFEGKGAWCKKDESKVVKRKMSMHACQVACRYLLMRKYSYSIEANMGKWEVRDTDGRRVCLSKFCSRAV